MRAQYYIGMGSNLHPLALLYQLALQPDTNSQGFNRFFSINGKADLSHTSQQKELKNKFKSNL